MIIIIIHQEINGEVLTPNRCIRWFFLDFIRHFNVFFYFFKDFITILVNILMIISKKELLIIIITIIIIIICINLSLLQ